MIRPSRPEARISNSATSLQHWRLADGAAIGLRLRCRIDVGRIALAQRNEDRIERGFNAAGRTAERNVERRFAEDDFQYAEPGIVERQRASMLGAGEGSAAADRGQPSQPG